MSLFKIVSPEISVVSLSWLWRNKKWLPQSLSIESQPASLRESPGDLLGSANGCLSQ